MKNLKRPVVKGLLLFSTLFLFYACGKEEIKPEMPSSEQVQAEELDQKDVDRISIKNGILAFEDHDHFKSVTDDLQSYSEVINDELQTKFDFTSLQSLINADQERLLNGGRTVLDENTFFQVFEQDRQDIPVIDYPFYTKGILLNEDGAVYIGEQLIQFTKDFVYTINSGDVTALEQTHRITTSGEHDDIYASKVKDGLSSNTARNTITKYGIGYNVPDNPNKMVFSGLTLAAWSIPLPGGASFMNYLDISFGVEKWSKSTPSSSWGRYDCGGASIASGNILYDWGNAPFNNHIYGYQLQTNDDHTHTFGLVSISAWNEDEYTVNLIGTNSHTTTGEFAVDCPGFIFTAKPAVVNSVISY